MEEITAHTRAGWDRPVRRSASAGRIPEGTPVRAPQPGVMPTIGEAITAWIHAKGFAPSPAKAARQHLESGRALGWRQHHGITTIDQLTSAECAAYLIYLRDRGAAPATLRKVKTLFSSLAGFCEATPGYEAGFAGTEMAKLKLPSLVERIPDALTEAECLQIIGAARRSATGWWWRRSCCPGSG